MPNPFGQLGRRTFLLFATAAAAAFGWRPPVWPQAAPEAASGAGLGFAFSHPDSAIAIGRRYLSRYPDHAGARALADELGRAGAGDLARSALRARVREDFERGDTVLLEGWVLARSECRACAAVALAADAAAANLG